MSRERDFFCKNGYVADMVENKERMYGKKKKFKKLDKTNLTYLMLCCILSETQETGE